MWKSMFVKCFHWPHPITELSISGLEVPEEQKETKCTEASVKGGIEEGEAGKSMRSFFLPR